MPGVAEVLNAPPSSFGETFDRSLDGVRIGTQLKRNYELMKDNQWRTLLEIERVTGDPQASISARLRDLRKARFGGYNVERRRRTAGLWEYRIAPGNANSPD